MYLGLDLGTTNVKAVVLDRSGEIVSEGAHPVSRRTLPGGGVEQDIEDIWSATLAALKQAAEAVPGSEPIRALGVSSQGGAMQWLDTDQNPVGPVISWMDGRGRPYDAQLDLDLGPMFLVEHTGRSTSGLTLGQSLRLQNERPPWIQAAEYLGFVGDVIVGRLCGRRAHDATSQSIAMLLNPRLVRSDPELLERLRLAERQLPDLLAATTAAGSLLAGVAEQTGLPAGIPVSAAIHDQYAATIGVGSVREGDVCLGTGTAWVLLANAAALSAPATPGAFVCPHPVRGLYGQMLSMGNGGSALEWALRLLRQEHLSGEALDALLGSVSPGAEGLCFWPLLSGGACAAGLPGGGRFAGLRLHHGPAEVLRAVVEGLACELARHLRMLHQAGISAERLLMCGTAAASRITPRILADVTRCPVLCGPEAPVSAVGASIIARAIVEDKPLGQLSLELAARRTADQCAIEPCADTPYGPLLARYNVPFESKDPAP